MRVLPVRNVHEALPLAIRLLSENHVLRNSRNGPVLVAPWPVTTVYEKPWERVLFWPQRDCNPFFHLFESLWMLAGRNDVAPLVRYAKQMAEYSDDGRILHGAYGYRWRRYFNSNKMYDQLVSIAATLQRNPEDRRCVLQMWDTIADQDEDYKDVPCNLIATFQRDFEGKLNLTVFCRSNDIVWGAYGANAVHFSLLQEYMATWIGCAMGTYTQVSVNWHAYLDKFKELKDLPKAVEGFYADKTQNNNPYGDFKVQAIPLWHGTDIHALDRAISELLLHAETGFELMEHASFYTHDEPFFDTAYLMLRAHHAWRTLPAPQRFTESLGILALGDQTFDWIVAGTEWLTRRQQKWMNQINPTGKTNG